MQLKYFCCGFSLFLSVCLFTTSVNAATTYDLATTTNYNLRYDGAAAGDLLPTGGLVTADRNNDGIQDLLIGPAYTDNNSRNLSGSLYIIYGALIDDYTGTANNIDLSDPLNYNLRLDGAAANDHFSDRTVAVADLDADGKLDIIAGAIFSSNNGRVSSGSLYVIYGTLIDDYSGTGNNIDMADPANYNLRYDGAAAGDYFAYETLKIIDVDNDDKLDILVGAPFTDYNSRSQSGSLYAIYNTLIDNYTGTGNNIDLANSSNYNLRYDGPVVGFNFPHMSATTGDLDNDDNNDVLIGFAHTDYNSRSDSGSLYAIYNTLIDNYTGTGNNIDLATSSNYNLRYDGAVADDSLGNFKNIKTADIDNDDKSDILIGVPYADNNSHTNAGSIYIIYNSLVDDYTGTGNSIDLATSANFNLRIDGAADNNAISLRAFNTGDIDNDNKADILVGSRYTDFNSRTDSGSLYVIYNSLIDNYTGSGNTFDLSSSTNYNIRFDGPATSIAFTYGTIQLGDLDGNGTQDILIGDNYADNNSRENSGSAYLIYNFPHTLSINYYSTPTGDNTPTLSGEVTASDSITNISMVQYQMDSNSINGNWSNCAATDGSFNSKSENFSCSVASLLTDGLHTIYFRAYDENTSYTTQANYASTSFTVDTTQPSSFALISPSSYTNSDLKPTLIFKKSADSSSISSYTVSLDPGKSQHYQATSIPSSGNGTASYIWKDDNEVKIVYFNEHDQDSSNDEINLYFKGLDSNQLTEGKHTWTVAAHDNAGNARTQTEDFYIDRTNPTIADLAIAEVSRVTYGDYYFVDGSNRMPSFSGKINDLYKGSTKNNANGSSDTFDPISSGPNKIYLTVKKLGANQNPNKKNAVFDDYLIKDYPVSEIQNISNEEKHARFFITTFYPLADGYYQIKLTAQDRVGNSSDTPFFYITVNYQKSSTTNLVSKRDSSTNGNLETKVVEEKAIPVVSQEEKKQLAKEGYQVKIKVIDQNNQAIVGAKVTLHSQVQETITNNQGVAKFANVKAGDHRIIVAYQHFQGEQPITLAGDVKEFHYTIQVKPILPFGLYGIITFLVFLNVFMLIYLLKIKCQQRLSYTPLNLSKFGNF